jgi:hypothetical protein
MQQINDWLLRERVDLLQRLGRAGLLNRRSGSAFQWHGHIRDVRVSAPGSCSKRSDPEVAAGAN